MESRSLFLPINVGLLHRPRIDALLSKGTRTPFVALVAGPGYGKTFAVAKYVEKYSGRLVWLHLQKLDNLPHHFWQSFVEAGRLETSELSGQFESAGFPATPGAFDAFLRSISQSRNGDEPIVLVIDDFHLVTSGEILLFFAQLIGARISGFTVVLCGAAPAQLETLTRQSGVAPFTITMDALCFSRGEVADLIELQGTGISSQSADAIWQRTEGWPLAVNLMTSQLRFDPGALDATRWMDLSLTENLFEREFFSAYTSEVRALLVKLSLLADFTQGIVEAIGGFNPEQVDKLLADHLFIACDKPNGIYYFQHMYRQFLSERAIIIDEEERRRVYSVSADERLRRGETLEALELLAHAGRHSEMLAHVAAFNNSGMPKQLATYLYDLIATLPPDLPEVSSLAEYLKATILLNNMEIHNAGQMLLQLAARLEEGKGIGGNKEALGEVYLTLAAICLIRNEDCFLEYYRKAADIFHAGSVLKDENQRFVGNNRVFFLQHNKPGEVARLEKIYHEAEPYIVQVMNGGGKGVAELFSAEGAYNTGNLAKARQHAEAAIRTAEAYRQPDIVYNARLILAMAAMYDGSLRDLLTPLAAIHTDAAGQGQGDLYELRDTIEGWFYVKMGDLERIAPWLIAGDEVWSQRPPISVGRDRLLYANYLVRRQDFHTLIDFLAPLEQIYRMRGHWTERLNVYILRAIGHLNNGNEKAALQSLWQGYEMSHANGITAPFAEGAWYMRILVDVARKNATFPFPSAWLDDIYRRSSVFMENISVLMEDYRTALHALGRHDEPTAETRLLQVLTGARSPHSKPAPLGGRVAAGASLL